MWNYLYLLLQFILLNIINLPFTFINLFTNRKKASLKDEAYVKLAYDASCLAYDAYDENLNAKWKLHKKLLRFNNKNNSKKESLEDENEVYDSPLAKKGHDSKVCLACRMTEPNYIHDTTTDAELFIFILDNTFLVLNFTGTDSIEDIMYDLNIKTLDLSLPENNDAIWELPSSSTTTNKEYLVQQGFFLQFNSVLHRIRNLVTTLLKHNPQIKNVLCTGHSLGGALATLYATLETSTLKKQHKHLQNIFLITFGCPRVMNRNMDELAYERITYIKRYVYFRDPIATLPIWGPRFTHLTKEIRLGVQHLSDNVFYQYTFGWFFIDVFFITSHHIKNYTNALKKQII